MLTSPKQNGSKLLITCSALGSFSPKEAFSSSGAMNYRFIHVESTTSVCLSLPPFIVLYPDIFSLVSSVARGLQDSDGLQGFTTLLCMNLQTLEHPYSASVSVQEPELCSDGATMFN